VAILARKADCQKVQSDGSDAGGGPSVQSLPPKRGSLDEYLKKFSHVKDYSRKMDIQPVKQTTGITTGVVMICGHIIPPPYKAEFKGEVLYVNGVQVHPSPLMQRYNREHPRELKPLKPEMQKKSDEMARLLRLAEKRYDEDKATRKDHYSREIVDFLHNQSTMTFDAGWNASAETICIRPKGYFQECWALGDSAPGPSPQDRTRIAAQNRAVDIFSIETGLRKGKFMEFGCTGGHGGVEPQDIRPAVNTIMRMPGLSREQRIELLKERVFAGDYGSALDVVDNYVAEEWVVAPK
jgi:hypothetical protein